MYGFDLVFDFFFLFSFCFSLIKTFSKINILYFKDFVLSLAKKKKKLIIWANGASLLTTKLHEVVSRLVFHVAKFSDMHLMMVEYPR